MEFSVNNATTPQVGTYDSWHSYKFNSRQHVFYDVLAQRWFVFCYNGMHTDSGYWLDDDGGWYIKSWSTLNGENADGVSSENWQDVIIFAPNGAGQLETKKSLFPGNAYVFNPVTYSDVDWMNSVTTESQLAERLGMFGQPTSNTSPQCWYTALDSQISVAFDAPTQTFHIVNYNSNHIFYSKWTYHSGNNSITQVNINNILPEFYNTFEGHQIEAYGDTVTFDILPPTLDHLPWHRHLISGDLGYSNFPDISLFPPAYVIHSPDEDEEWQLCNTEVWGFKQVFQNVEIFIYDDRPFISVPLHWESNKSGRSWIIGDGGVGDIYSFSLPTLRATTDIEGYLGTHSPGTNNIFSTHEQEYGQLLTLWTNYEANQNATLMFNYNQFNGVTSALNYQTDGHELRELIYDESGGIFNPGLELFEVRGPTTAARYVILFGTHEDSNGVIPYLNIGIKQDNGDISMVFESIDPTYYTEYISYWPMTGDALIGPYTKMFANSSGSMVHLIYSSLENGDVLKKTLDIGRIEELNSLGQMYNFMEEIFLQEPEVLNSGVSAAKTGTIQGVDYTHPTVSMNLLFRNVEGSFSLDGFALPIIFDPGVASIFDYFADSIKSSSVIVKFTLNNADLEYIDGLRFIAQQDPIFQSDFEGLPLVMLNDLEQEPGETDTNTTIFRYEIKDLVGGITYYSACLPSLTVGNASISNQCTFKLPDTSIAIGSDLLTVPIEESGGAAFIGTGNKSGDSPKYISRLSHSQFGTNYDRVVIEDAECESPTGSSSIVTFDSLTTLHENESAALRSWQVGFEINGQHLFFIHKETGETKKTNNLGVKIKALCNSQRINGGIWIWDEDTQEVHLMKVDLNNINDTVKYKTYNVEYSPRWNEVGNDTLSNTAIYQGDIGGEQAHTDLVNSSVGLKFTDIAEITTNTSSVLVLMAETQELVKPGHTAFIKLKPFDTLEHSLIGGWAPEQSLYGKDCSFSWNKFPQKEIVNRQITLEENVEDYTDYGEFGVMGRATSFSGLYEDPNTIYTRAVDSGEFTGFVSTPHKFFNEDIGTFEAFPHKGAADATRFINPSINHASREVNVIMGSMFHGPHAASRESVLEASDEFDIQYGYTPIPGTLHVESGDGYPDIDSVWSCYVRFTNVKYKHVWYTQEKGQDGVVGTMEECYNETILDGVYHIKVGSDSKGWNCVYNRAYQFDDDTDDTYHSGYTRGIPLPWDFKGKDKQLDAKTDDYIDNSGSFDTMQFPNFVVSQSGYEDVDFEGNLNSCTNSLNTKDYSDQSRLARNTTILALNSNISDVSKTKIVMEEPTVFTEGHKEHNLGSSGVNYDLCWPILRTQDLQPITTVAEASWSAENKISPFGWVEIDFGDSASTTYNFWNDYETSTSSGDANAGATTDPLRCTSFDITGIRTPFKFGNDENGRGNLYSKFKILFWEPVDQTHAGSINYDPSGAANATFARTMMGLDGGQAMFDYTTTHDTEGRANDVRDRYVGQDGLFNEFGGLDQCTVIVNRRFFLDDSGGGDGALGSPDTEKVVDAIVTTYDKMKTMGLGHPFIGMVSRKTIAGGGTSAEKGKLVIYFTYPQDKRSIGFGYNLHGANIGYKKFASSSEEITAYSGDLLGASKGPHTAALSTTNLHEANDNTKLSHVEVDTTGYQNAIVEMSTDSDGSLTDVAQMSTGYDEQCRIFSRSSDIVYGKLFLRQNKEYWTGSGSAGWGYGNSAFHYLSLQGSALALGSSITTTPGSVVITGGELGTYNEGTCTGVTDEDAAASSTYDDDKNQCEAFGGNWIRTGSSKFDPKKKYYYRMSYTYDGFQESPLSQTSWSFDVSNEAGPGQQSGYNSLQVKIKLREVPLRCTHVTIWRKDDDEEALFRSVKQVSLSGGWIFNGTNYTRTIDDSGKEGPSYEALVGHSSTITSSTIHYSMSTIVNNQMFVGLAAIKETGESYPNLLFRSMPGAFSIFNWANDYVKLPSVPTAICGMNRMLYAWDVNRMYIIDPNQMYVVEEYEGLGCLGKESVITSEQGMFWFDKHNIYLLPRTGGIDYIGNRILTSEHGIGWQEQDPVAPYKAIYDSKRKAFGMIKTHMPQKEGARYYKIIVEETSESTEARRGGTEGDYRSFYHRLNHTKNKLPNCDYKAILDEIKDQNCIYKFKKLEKKLLSKDSKSNKNNYLKTFTNNNKNLLNKIMKHVKGKVSVNNMAIVATAVVKKALHIEIHPYKDIN